MIIVTSALAPLLVLVGAGSAAAPGLLQPSPTPSPEPTGPAVQLLNPAGIDPFDGGENPKISDKADGVDEAYHIVAATRDAPAGATVRAFWTPDGGTESEVGALTKLGADTWEFFWEIPDSVEDGSGTLSVRLIQAGTEIASDEVLADIDRAEETTEFSWPENNGSLGFFKARGGSWATVLDVFMSDASTPQRLIVYYSVTPVGEEPEYKQCNMVNSPAGTEGASFSQLNCPLAGEDTPSQVTAVAAVATETDTPVLPAGLLTLDSSDAHRVRGFVQDPEEMNVAVAGVPPTDPTAAWPTSQRRVAGSDCLEFDVTVTDQMDRPVQGANVDVHVSGPDDEVGFGDEASTAHGSSGYKTPDEGEHETEDAWDCEAPGDHFGSQGDHDEPADDDTKHNESTAGTGLSGPSGIRRGQWRFHVFSPNPGRTTITAWVDSEPIADESEQPPADDDVRDSDEPSATIEAQWLPGPARIIFVPPSSSTVAETCHSYLVRARAAGARLDGVNVDIHATGPSNDLDFCDPVGASPRRAPDMGDHEPEDEGEAQHPGADSNPSTQHAEGETDDEGNMVIGLTSPVAGDTTITGWIDGEVGQDNDVKSANEAGGSTTTSWAISAEDAEVRFVNPSGYGGSGDRVSRKTDANDHFHVVARVDLPDLVEGVELRVSSDGGASFSFISLLTRVGGTDTYEYFWPVPVANATYTLQVRILETEKFENRTITVNNGMETAEIASPEMAAPAPFVDGATTITGTVSASADIVKLFYTPTAARDTRNSAQWTACGEVELEASGDEPQPFSGSCELAEGVSPAEVSGLAAHTVDCDANLGCGIPPSPVGGDQPESGDAHRVFGFDATPSIAIDAPEDAAVGDCQKVTVRVTDDTGEAIPALNTDVHISGPDGEGVFCEPPGRSSDRRAPDEGSHADAGGGQGIHDDETTRHTEGETDAGGVFIVGVRSDVVGDSELAAWVDGNDNDLQEGEEPAAEHELTWSKLRTKKHARKISLRLKHVRGDLLASGRVRTRDGYSRCHRRVPVKVQRRKGGRFVTVTRVNTNKRGRYDALLADRPGRYRAMALKARRGADPKHVCKPATKVRRHRH